jgi:hypothetical protein
MTVDEILKNTVTESLTEKLFLIAGKQTIC